MEQVCCRSMPVHRMVSTFASSCRHRTPTITASVATEKPGKVDPMALHSGLERVLNGALWWALREAIWAQISMPLQISALKKHRQIHTRQPQTSCKRVLHQSHQSLPHQRKRSQTTTLKPPQSPHPALSSPTSTTFQESSHHWRHRTRWMIPPCHSWGKWLWSICMLMDTTSHLCCTSLPHSRQQPHRMISPSLWPRKASPSWRLDSCGN